ncbi:MAG TPA: class I SAM-dependent rRNA methyltransferase [Thermoanaerobaculia bacterium]|nr:class I SAM-dependent rRNA methyltransferase [Thermoanaerobaculia bacterium]
MLVLTLSPGRENSVLRRHPWLFSGAVRSRTGDEADGRAEVRTSAGEVVGRGIAGSGRTIVAKLWTFGAEPFDRATIASRFRAARALRERVVPDGTSGYRTLHAEGDLVPGVVADRYGGTDVLQLGAGGAAAIAGEIVEAYRETFAPGGLLVRGEGEPSPESVPSEAAFLEHGLRFAADLAGGQKTGFFLDQRENRARIRRLSPGRTVLNLFSYSGGFSVAALAGGAVRAVDVDSSEAALAFARRHRRDNGFAAADEDFVRADVFGDLRVRAAAGERWDVVVLDPPAFAKKKSDIDRAARGYKDVARLAMALVTPGGMLLACSCSGVVSPELFQQILFAAALDARRTFAILEKAGAGPDHPVSIYCPESEYLKAFFLAAADDAP